MQENYLIDWLGLVSSVLLFDSARSECMYEWAAVEFFVYGDYHGSYSFHENTVLFIMPCYPEYIVETTACCVL